MESKKIVLIIDDDSDDIDLFIDALKEIDSSIELLSAKGGQEGLDFLKKAKKLPDLIFLDLNMPCINGKHCLIEIKNNSSIAHIPVIIYSTTKRMEDVEETKKAGAASFLTKPILFKDIRSSIEILLTEQWGKSTSH